MAGEWAASQAISLILYIQIEVEFESLSVWLKHSKVEHGFSKKFSNSLFLSPSVFQNRIASATFRSFKDTFIYVYLNLTLGFKLVTEQSTENMMLLVMPFHARGSQSIFQVFQAVVTDFTKAIAWEVAQTTLVLHLKTCYWNLQRTSIPIFPINRQAGAWGLSVCLLCFAGSLWPCRCDSSWVISAGCQGRATPDGPGSSRRGAERARGRLADLVKRKEHPWGIFESEGWTETTIACEEFYFAQPLKLWNFSQHKKWKKPTRELTARFWAALSHLGFLLRLNYTPAWITLLLIIKAFHSNTLFTQITKRVTTTSICKLVLNWNIS